MGIRNELFSLRFSSEEARGEVETRMKHVGALPVLRLMKLMFFAQQPKKNR